MRESGGSIYHAIAVARDAIGEDSVAQLLEALDDITARRPLMEEMAQGCHDCSVMLG